MEPTLRVIGISGTPKRSKSSTRYLLEVALDELAAAVRERGREVETEILDLHSYDVQPCTGCDLCVRRKPCPLSENDDMPEIEKILSAADAIIIAAPSYFCSVPGILKNLIDRSRPMKMSDHMLKDKLFSAITYAGLKYGGQETVIDYLNKYALTQGMIVVGALGSPIHDGIAGIGSMQTDEGKWRLSKDDDLAIKSSRVLGRRLAEVLVMWRSE